MDISKKDWALFREKLAGWQEAYMEKLLQEYEDLIRSDGNASDRFWELDERIKADKRKPGVILEVRKSNVVYDLAKLIRDGAISVNDLADFSDDVQEYVKHLLNG